MPLLVPFCFKPFQLNQALTAFDKSFFMDAETLRLEFSSLKYVQKNFYDEMLCFSKLDGSLNFQNVPNFYFILVTNNQFEENSK